jgi:hypothetical protein
MTIWAALWLSLAYRLMNGPSWDVFVAAAAIFCGIIASDGISGFLHWFCDTFLEETTPVIGVQLIAPFREHHRDPLALTRHGFLELCGNSAAAFLSVLTPVWWFGPAEPQSQLGVFGYLFVLTFSLILTATNQLHSWAHNSAPPRIVHWLQRAGLALSAKHHSPHHAPPYRTNYCVTNGWVNPFADRFSIFLHAERIFVRLGVPRKGSET